jgi:hypothetical protein
MSALNLNPDFATVLEPFGEGAQDFFLAASLYHAGKISFGKAAELARLGIVAFHERLREHFGYGMVITDETAREDLAAVAELSDTDHLLRSPVNARRLRDAIAELEQGSGTQHDLID